jgi:hypothetical protein
VIGTKNSIDFPTRFPVSVVAGTRCHRDVITHREFAVKALLPFRIIAN